MRARYEILNIKVVYHTTKPNTSVFSRQNNPKIHKKTGKKLENLLENTL